MIYPIAADSSCRLVEGSLSTIWQGFWAAPSRSVHRHEQVSFGDFEEKPLASRVGKGGGRIERANFVVVLPFL
jgi:hypothetical protein